MGIARLKRSRNSLLSIRRLPPEVPGDIFRRNVAPEGTFGRLEERSHNFLLVCHHWFIVASRTPEVWSFWGNNLEDWKKRHLRYSAAPFDLVLDEEPSTGETLDNDNNNLRNALQDRVVRDTIRRIHLDDQYSESLRSIISSLAGSGEIRSNSVESVIILDRSNHTSVDVSDLLAYYRFPKLRRLKLDNCVISSWDLITSRTSTLTILFLAFSHPTPTPTMSQLLSILGSNPALQEISLFGCTIPDDGGGRSSARLSLHHLRELRLSGDL